MLFGAGQKLGYGCCYLPLHRDNQPIVPCSKDTWACLEPQMSLPASGVLFHTWRDTAAAAPGEWCFEQHGMEKQVLILTPWIEARMHVSHTCWTSDQTPATWCLPRCTCTHREPHTGSLPDFQALSRLIPAGPTQQLPSRADIMVENELDSTGSWGGVELLLRWEQAMETAQGPRPGWLFLLARLA